ncbi:MAG: hypothetical protein GY820_39075 [Gammaproteobacteria bacterium]|nr:hypothetical protein [Gammaproteobacteria bacterium]
MKNMSVRETKFWYWVVRNLMPKKIIYFSFFHVMAHSTTGEYGDTIVPELTGMDAIDRYGKDNGF